MKLTYLKTLQRAWDRYSIDQDVFKNKKHTNEDKINHLTSFMKECTHKEISLSEYEFINGISKGMISEFTKWLLKGRLGDCNKELIYFYTERVNRPRCRKAK